MLNRIRRAVALARARHVPKGRHRRTLRPSRPPIALASPASADEPTFALAQAVDEPSHRHLLRGEDSALVRPYVLAREDLTRRRPTVVIAPYLSTDAWSNLLGVQ
ncbi:hypothetical protein C9J60_09630 [Streptomyces sp. A244]|uniref:hypothetical protein n=1 Tax=Streptomyces sp. A244 TaxID=2137016 RepID=UPI000D1A9C0E|nr:hypothetical protein [Streptomyces sp. A244]PTH89058.1 hypothetical protein C9J60_09630 [Streptomyces sp. A244]